MSLHIDRCVCTQRTFADLLQQADAQGLSPPQLAEATGASACCGMCGPYLRRACRTRQVVFDRLLSDDDEPAVEVGCR